MSQPQPNNAPSLNDFCHQMLTVAAIIAGSGAAHAVLSRVWSRVLDSIQRRPMALLRLLLGQEARRTLEGHIRRLTEYTARGWCGGATLIGACVPHPTSQSGTDRGGMSAQKALPGATPGRALKEIAELRALMRRGAAFRGAADPEDVVQIAWAKMIATMRRHPCRFLAFAFQADPKGAIEAYALEVTKKVTWDARTRGSRQRRALDDLQRRLISDVVQPNEAAGWWKREDDRVTLCRGLSALSPEDRALIRWFVVEGVSREQICQRLGLPPSQKNKGSVSTRVFRARHALEGAVRAQRCLACLDRRVLQLLVFQGQSVAQIWRDLKFLSEASLSNRLACPSDPLAAAIRFLSGLSPSHRVLFRHYYLDHFPVEYISQALGHPSVASTAHRLQRILWAVVASVGPLSA